MICMSVICGFSSEWYLNLTDLNYKNSSCLFAKCINTIITKLSKVIIKVFGFQLLLYRSGQVNVRAARPVLRLNCWIPYITLLGI